ncbi:sensor histidine kinase [Streptomyces sp. NPDC012623]|uniref:sensor histidine kinase n=1 Tax=unclassified Streptomyces TaxID=2593676 RepID=UPI0036CB5892
MSQLRAPARPERREGGRHGRPGPRSPLSPARAEAPTPPDTRIRPQLVRTAVLPATVAALSGAAAVALVLRSTGAEPTAQTWAALFGTALLAFAAVAAAALGAERTARSVLGRCDELRLVSVRGQAELRAVVERLERGERVGTRRSTGASGDGVPGGPDAAAIVLGDEFDLLAKELRRSQEAALGAVVHASQISASVKNEQKVEVFVNLARRLQSLVHREIQLLDELENEVEDPELLKGLFHVDHLATRIRRHAENLAVLGGAVSRRQWSRPVAMTEVLRSAIAEVEQYPRIKLVPPIDGTLRGHAVADVIHLLAELVENATLFSSPHTQVLLRAQHVTAGLAIEVEDRGLGMPADEQQRMNALLTDPDQVNVAHLLQDGRIGLFVVSALARRHGIAVRLQANIYGGVQAVLVLPQTLLGSDRTDEPGRGRGHGSGHGPGHGSGPGSAHGSAAPAVPPVQQPQPEARPQPSRPRQQAQPYGQQRQQQLQQPQRPQMYERPPHAQSSENGTGQPGAPTPLPVRGAHDRRPGPRHADRRPESAAVPPPRPSAAPAPGGADAAVEADGTIHSAASRPQLPRRRGQEHLVPQLRDAPAPPRTGDPVLHDPGLMAAFQRGIGLAESRPDTDAVPVPHADPLDDRPADPLPEPQRHDTTPTSKE